MGLSKRTQDAGVQGTSLGDTLPQPPPRTQPLARHSALLFQRCVWLCLRAPETPCAAPTGVVAKVRTGWGGRSLVGWQRQPGQSRAAPGPGARPTSCSRSLWALSGCANGRAPAPLFLVELRGAFGQDGASSEVAPGGLFQTVCLRVDVGIPRDLGGGMPGSSLEWHSDASVPLRAQPDHVVGDAIYRSPPPGSLLILPQAESDFPGALLPGNYRWMP